VLSEEPIEIGSVSALVMACGHESSNELLNALSDFPGDVVGVGDCLAPRTVEEAVLEGLVESSKL
jgi:hypothetical protein